MPASKALPGKSVHPELLSSTTHRQQSNIVMSCKILIFGLKKAKKLEFKSIDSNERSPLSTDTFTDQKPPKKLR